MNKINLTFLLLAFTTLSFSQAFQAEIAVRTAATLSPGEIETMSIKVTNTCDYPFIIGKSVFAVNIHYDGSTNAGQVFNQTIKLPKTLQKGESYTFSNISYKSPIYPGTYPVEISFIWGNRVISQVEVINFTVEANYEATISASALSFDADNTVDLNFKVTNSGNTGWPDGATYSLKFELLSSPSAAPKEDKARFDFTPRVFEKWDLDPGRSEEFNIPRFKVPRVSGSYKVRVHLLMNGRTFNAAGNFRDFTFKVGR